MKENPMSFREKTAWVTLIAIILVTVMFWFHLMLIGRNTGIRTLHAMLISLVAYILIEVVGYFVLRLRNPRDARMPRDERERLIDLKALRIAYFVFTVVSIGGIFVTLHLVHDGAHVVGMVVFMAFILSQMVKHSARIIYFRRGG